MFSGRDNLDNLKMTIDIRALLSYYGANILLDSGENIRSNCVVHGGQNKSSLSYNATTGFFRCFGECGFCGDVFKLIQTIENCTFSKALEIARSFAVSAPNGYAPSPREIRDEWAEMFESTYGESNANEVIYSPLVNQALCADNNPYVESGKFHKETMKYFEVGYCDFNEYFMHRAIITIHDDQGNLIGFSGRDMKNSDNTNKYRIKKGFKKGYCLYNLNRAKDYISRKEPMVLVEGFGQVWRLHEAGVRTAVALMGKDATRQQLDLILTYTTNLVLGMDFDGPGLEGTLKLIQQLDDKIDLTVLHSPFGENIDLADLSVENVRQIYDSAIPPYLWYNQVYKNRQKGGLK
jgi:DNA primase